MKIDNIKIFRNNVEDSNLLGICQVTLDDKVTLTGLKIYRNADGNLVVRYPKNMGSKKNLNYYFPVDPAFRENFENQILDAFEGIENG